LQQQRFAQAEQRRQEIEVRIKRLMEESKLAVSRALQGNRSPPKKPLAPPDRPRITSPVRQQSPAVRTQSRPVPTRTQVY